MRFESFVNNIDHQYEVSCVDKDVKSIIKDHHKYCNWLGSKS